MVSNEPRSTRHQACAILLRVNTPHAHWWRAQASATRTIATHAQRIGVRGTQMRTR